MTANQRIWARARNDLEAALSSAGYPAELADLLTKHLGRPRSIERMTAWMHQAHPGSMEMIVDEMLAICADAQAWREKKKSQEAQAGYNAWLNSAARWEMEEDEERQNHPFFSEGGQI